MITWLSLGQGAGGQETGTQGTSLLRPSVLPPQLKLITAENTALPSALKTAG